MLHWTVQSPRSQVSMRTRIEEEMTKAYALWPPARARVSLAWSQMARMHGGADRLLGWRLLATVVLGRCRGMFRLRRRRRA